MALNLRATIEASDIYGNNLETRIYLEGFSGTPVTRKGTNDPLEIQWGDDSSELLPLVYGCQANIRFYAENNFEFTDLFVTTARDVFIEIELTDTGTTIFKGFIEPGKWSEPLIEPPYEVSLTAYDGLGLLKDEDFLDASRDYYEGEYTAKDLLQLILSKTGQSLPLNTAVNIRPSGESTGSDALTQYKKDLYTYRENNCYEVLENMFQNVRIFQRMGQWYAISNDNFNKSTFTIYKYLANGTANGTATINPAASSWWFEDEVSMDLMPPLKQVKLKHDFGFRSNLIENSNFATIEGGTFSDWTKVNALIFPRVLDEKGSKYGFIPGYENNSNWYDPRTDYIKSKGIPTTATTNKLHVGLSYALIGNSGNSAIVMFGLQLVANSGNIYYMETHKHQENDDWVIKYHWQLTTSILGTPVDMIVEKDGWLFQKQYERQIQKTDAYPFEEISDKFKRFSGSIDLGIPEDGTLYLYLFKPQDADPAEILGVAFREVSLRFTDPDNEDLPTFEEIVLINSNANTFAPDDIEILNGDVPQIDNQLTIYHGSFIKTSDNTSTSVWQLDGNANTYSYVELMLRMLASQSRLTKQSYNGTVGDVFPFLGLVLTDPSNSNNKFVEAGVTYEFRHNRASGRYVQITEINLTAYTVTSNNNYEPPATNQGTAASTPALPPSADEKVIIIDDEYQKATKPGYLSDEDFLTVENTEGRAMHKMRLTWSLNEIATGTINGVNTIFTIANTPISNVIVTLYPATRLHPNDFALVDKTITLTNPPVGDEVVIVDYPYLKTTP